MRVEQAGRRRTRAATRQRPLSAFTKGVELAPDADAYNFPGARDVFVGGTGRPSSAAVGDSGGFRKYTVAPDKAGSAGGGLAFRSDAIELEVELLDRLRDVGASGEAEAAGTDKVRRKVFDAFFEEVIFRDTQFGFLLRRIKDEYDAGDLFDLDAEAVLERRVAEAEAATAAARADLTMTANDLEAAREEIDLLRAANARLEASVAARDDEVARLNDRVLRLNPLWLKQSVLYARIQELEADIDQTLTETSAAASGGDADPAPGAPVPAGTESEVISGGGHGGESEDGNSGSTARTVASQQLSRAAAETMTREEMLARMLQLQSEVGLARRREKEAYDHMRVLKLSAAADEALLSDSDSFGADDDALGFGDSDGSSLSSRSSDGCASAEWVGGSGLTYGDEGVDDGYGSLESLGRSPTNRFVPRLALGATMPPGSDY